LLLRQPVEAGLVRELHQPGAHPAARLVEGVAPHRGPDPGARLSPLDLPRGDALAGRGAAGVQARHRLPVVHRRRGHPARLSGRDVRGDAEGRLPPRSPQAAEVDRPDRSGAAARRIARSDTRAGALGRAQGSDAPGPPRRRGAARRNPAARDRPARATPGGVPVKVLVTGATGFLGSTLLPLLREAGHEVRALVRSGASVAGAEAVKGDVRDPESLRRALQGVEGLIHLAGLVSRDPDDGRRMYELHVDGTRNLLTAAAHAGLHRIVLASSSGTIG